MLRSGMDECGHVHDAFHEHCRMAPGMLMSFGMISSYNTVGADIHLLIYVGERPGSIGQWRGWTCDLSGNIRWLWGYVFEDNVQTRARRLQQNPIWI